jgi:ABC-type branched-subunit amino acid transport system ATPase component
MAVDRLFDGLRSAVAQPRLAVLLVEQQAQRVLKIAGTGGT